MIKLSKNNGSSHVVVLCVMVVCLVIFGAIILIFQNSESKIIVQNNNPEPTQIDPPADNNKNSTPTENELTTENSHVVDSNKNAGLESSIVDSNVGDDLLDEELRVLYEKQLREESEKLRKLVEEELAFVPLVSDVDKLIQLHPQDRIWLEREVGAVVVTGRVVLREGMLELFACKTNSKEHESIVAIRVMPELIHAALLAVGAESGKPVQIKPEFIAPSGDEIEIRVKWQENGQIKESLAQDWIWDNANSNENDKKPMKTHWVFTGSVRYKDEDGKDHYVANETGELFGVSNFVGSILDVPIQSSADNDKLLFSCFTEKIPPVGTLVTIILTPRKNK
ncbi:MAG: YdjY domain-containing protein [Planctomycetaceae bacterium]|jgi:hypothetical protein|nr:YdjY domain-containing protein [Planctomycetaceae bacterium]